MSHCSILVWSSRPALTLEPGQSVIEYSGAGPSCSLESSLFIQLPRWGYQSKQMCINKKVFTFIMEKHEYKQAEELIVWGARVPPSTICRNLLGLELSKSLHWQMRLQFHLFTPHLQKGSADERQGTMIVPAAWCPALLREEREKRWVTLSKPSRVHCCGLNTLWRACSLLTSSYFWALLIVNISTCSPTYK